MQHRKVKKVTQIHLQHIHIDFEDGTMAVISRNDAIGNMPEVGKMWPPSPLPSAADLDAVEAEKAVK